MTIDDLLDTFELLGDWDARYDFISELGENTAGLAPGQRNHDTQVHGCMSQVWIIGKASTESPNRMTFEVDGDAPIVKGLAALLAGIYADRTPSEVLALDPDELFERLGLDEHLSPNRHVGMYAMVERIKAIARECLEETSADMADASTGARPDDGQSD